jgi:hypothetical protein
MAQIKARIWPSPAYLYQIFSTVARQDSLLGDPFDQPLSRKLVTHEKVKARFWTWHSDKSL